MHGGTRERSSRGWRARKPSWILIFFFVVFHYRGGRVFLRARGGSLSPSDPLSIFTPSSLQLPFPSICLRVQLQLYLSTSTTPLPTRNINYFPKFSYYIILSIIREEGRGPLLTLDVNASEDYAVFHITSR